MDDSTEQPVLSFPRKRDPRGRFLALPWVPACAGMTMEFVHPDVLAAAGHRPSSFWPRVARPGRVVLEGRFPDAVMYELKARDHKAEKGEDWSEGRLSALSLPARLHAVS